MPIADLTVEFILFAEFTSITEDRRLNIMGEFTDLDVPQVPAVLPALNIIYRVVGPPEAAVGSRQLSLELQAPDGQVIAKHQRVVQALTPEELAAANAQGLSLQLTSVARFYGQVLPAFGRYTVRLAIDGLITASRGLMVAQQGQAERG